MRKIIDTAVIYQLFLRPFTNEGTLKAAEQMLPHIASVGTDIVYVCPMFVHDDDEDRAGWSARQKKSALNNAKNPYRMKDYFHVDPEYGTDADLKDFIDAAHALGMKVMLDLVYFHCGPNAVFLAEHPDFIARNPDGTPALGDWCFPKLNYENPDLCEYMWSNMEYYVRDFGCDGYRCDVGDGVPIRFWREGIRRIRAIKPDIVMLNEGTRKEFTTDNAFDLNYDFRFGWTMAEIMKSDKSAQVIADYRKNYREEHLTPGSRAVLFYDNHDISCDQFEERHEKVLGFDAVNAMLFCCYTMDGVPFLYNGDEVADTHRHSIWGGRTTVGNLTIDWQNALTEKGQARLALVKTLAAFHKEHEAVACGEEIFLPLTSEAVVAYLRRTENETLLFAVSLKNREETVVIDDLTEDAVCILGGAEKNGKTLTMKPYSFAAYRL